MIYQGVGSSDGSAYCSGPLHSSNGAGNNDRDRRFSHLCGLWRTLAYSQGIILVLEAKKKNPFFKSHIITCVGFMLKCYEALISLMQNYHKNTQNLFLRAGFFNLAKFSF